MKKIFLFCLIVLGFYSCSNVPITGRRQFTLVNDDEVLTLSLQQYEEFMQTAKKSTDKTNTALVTKVGQKIADAVGSYYKANGQEALLSIYKWEFNLVDDSQVNAFCMPGGKIVVYTGILPYTKDETGLAVVLGHEVGHAIAKHANERLSNQLLLDYGGAGLGAVLAGKSAATQQIGSTVWGLGSQVGVMLPFSRKQELEADYLGMILMAIAGYDPAQALPFWERMAQQGQNVSDILSTHPSDQKRIEAIKKNIPEAMDCYKAIWGSGTTTAPKTTPAATPANTGNKWQF